MSAHDERYYEARVYLDIEGGVVGAWVRRRHALAVRDRPITLPTLLSYVAHLVRRKARERRERRRGWERCSVVSWLVVASPSDIECVFGE